MQKSYNYLEADMSMIRNKLQNGFNAQYRFILDNVTTDYPVYNDDDDDDIIIYDMHKSSISKIMFSYD